MGVRHWRRTRVLSLPGVVGGHLGEGAKVGFCLQHVGLWLLELGPCKSHQAPATAPDNAAAPGIRRVRECDVAALSAVMRVAPDVVKRRLLARNDCYVAGQGESIFSYAWIAFDAVDIPELERVVHPASDEAYVWDCYTLPAHRGRGLLPAILGHAADGLCHSRLQRAWAAIVADNHASRNAFARAEFRNVVDVRYIRLFRWRYLRFMAAQRASPHAQRAGRHLLGLE